jgi:hypothetical protein
MQGIIGAFQHLDGAVEAVEELRKSRMGDVTVYTPTPRHELEEALGSPKSPVRKFTLIGGALGVTFGYWIAIWTSEYWPLVTGGKAIGSWIPYTIIGFEMFVLIGSLATVAGMFINSRIPKLTMTVGYDPRFTHADFGIFVRCPPERAAAAEAVLRQQNPIEVRNER